MPKYDIKASYEDWSSGERHTTTQRYSGKNAHEAVEALKDNLYDEYAPEGVTNLIVISIKPIIARKKKPAIKKQKKATKLRKRN